MRQAQPRRRDAVHNRERILRTAVEVFAADGPGVPLTEIARRAGLGPATLYRHFPDRFCLATAVVEHRMAAVDRLVAGLDGDLDALRSAIHTVVASQLAVRPLLTVLRRRAQYERDLDRYTRRLVTQLAVPLRRAQAAGHLRTDLAADDLGLVVTMIEAVLDAHSGTDRNTKGDAEGRGNRAERAVGIVLDGLLRGTHADGTGLTALGCEGDGS
jgi:AcrR family transcriptional regulator